MRLHCCSKTVRELQLLIVSVFADTNTSRTVALCIFIIAYRLLLFSFLVLDELLSKPLAS